MKLRQGFLLIALLLLGGGLARGQTTFVTGNLTASAAVCTTAPSNTNHVTISTINFGGATFTASGGWAGTLSFYASGDGGLTWQPLNVTPSNSTTPVTSTSAVGLWQANVSAYTHVCMLASTYTSGTMVVRIHCSNISARAGGGGGGGSGGPITPPSGSLTGQTLVVAGSSVVGASPGILDSASNPISGAAFTPSCGTTNTGDRAHIMVITGTTTVTIPLSTATNCANSIFYFLVQGTGTGTFQPSGAEILDVYDGNSNYTACASGCTSPNLQLMSGQYATIDNGSGTTWHCLIEGPPGGGGGGATSLNSITSATASATPLVNAAFAIPWNWQLTGAQAGLSLGETAASTGGALAGGINNQSILQLQTASNSTASPLLINQGTQTGTIAIPALQLQTTWNNAGLAGQGLLIQATCTACAAVTSYPLNILNGAGTSVFSVNSNGTVTTNGAVNATGNLTSSGTITAANVLASIKFQANSSTGPATFTGGFDASAVNALGAGTFRGADNSNGAAGAAGGLGLFRGGVLSSGGATATEGVTEVASGYLGTGVAATGDIVCSTAVQFQITDCPSTTGVNIIGIANNIANPYIIVAYGTAPVRLTAAGTIGHTICLSTTTAGQATDSGGTGVCTTAGTQIGVIVATSGNVVVGSGTSTATVALSTTLPLVQLHFR